MSAQDLTLEKLIESIPPDYSIMISRAWTGDEWMVTVYPKDERYDTTILPWHQHFTVDPENDGIYKPIVEKVIQGLREGLAHAESGGRGWK